MTAAWLPTLLACADVSSTDTAGASPGADPTPVEAGPWDPGVTTLELVDDRGKALTIEVWYPAHVEPGATPDEYPEIPLALGAFRDVPAATEDGPFRLVAFTHGHVAIRYQSAFLMEHLASHGLVVVAPDHFHDTFLDAHESELWQIVLERPGDVMSSVDAVLRLSAEGDPVLGGLVEDPSYAVLGHSLGSITALSLGGGVADFGAFHEFCAQAVAAGLDYEGCGRVEGVDPDQAEGYPLVDPRAVLTVPMSPGLWYAFGPDGEGLSTVHVPLVLAGDQDELLSYEDEQRPTWEALGAPKALATVHTAGHYAFSDICLILPVWKECGGEEEGFIDMEVAKELTRGMVTAWVEAGLRGEVQALDWLSTWREEQPLLSWEEQP